MKAKPSPAGRRLAISLILALALVSAANAAETGTVTHLSGTLSVTKPDGSIKLLSQKSEVAEGDTLSTAKDSYARVKFNDGGEVTLRPNSQIKIASYQYDVAKPQKDNIVLDLLKGGLRSITGFIGKRNPNKYAMNTATATIGIRGTHFGVLFCQNDCANIPTVSGRPLENGVHLDVAEGIIAVTNNAGIQILNAGQFGYVRDAVTAPVIVPPDQGIRVTIPPAITSGIGTTGSVGVKNSSECIVQ